MLKLFIFALVAFTHTTSAMPMLLPKPFSSQQTRALAERLERAPHRRMNLIINMPPRHAERLESAPHRRALHVFPIPLMASKLREINSLANELQDSANTLFEETWNLHMLLDVLEDIGTQLAEAESGYYVRQSLYSKNKDILLRVFSDSDQIRHSVNHFYALLQSLQRLISPFNIATSIIDINTNITTANNLAFSAQGLWESVRQIIYTEFGYAETRRLLNSPDVKNHLNNINYFGGILANFARTLPELIRANFVQMEESEDEFDPVSTNPELFQIALAEFSRRSTSDRLTPNQHTD